MRTPITGKDEPSLIRLARASGESAYYDASMGHNVISTSAEDTLILWVTSMT